MWQEQPAGSRQTCAHTQAPLRSAHTFDPCVREKEASLAATGQSRGTVCIFHAWVSLIHSLSSNPADTALVPLSSLSIYLEPQEGGKSVFHQVTKPNSLLFSP